jgi:nicotinate-nucleotide pyrophosphorylase (carboxylating)
MLEKYAVQLGGGQNHRFGLDDGVVVRSNHAIMAGGLAAAVSSAKEKLGHLHRIEAQVANENELREALASGAEMLLFEGLAVEEVARLTALARELASAVSIECRGNITLENVRAYADSGVDMIGIGSLTNTARALDVSFQIQAF